LLFLEQTPVKSTRQKLLNMLKNKPGITAAEISRALQITQSNVRHHLANMLEEGLIVTIGQDYSGRRGRPARKFSLTALTFQDNFDLLSKALLTTYLEDIHPGNKKNFLQRVARNILGDISLRGPLSQRLVEGIEKLNTLGYQARWEAHSEAPRLIYERCPYAALRPEHPELCRFDTYLLELLLGESITQAESSAHLENGYCLFLVGKITQSSASNQSNSI
jgi:predicted ArsR family transcriptional regulator